MDGRLTIKALADALGVSKTAIRNYMNDEFRAKHTAKDDKGVITIDPEGCKLISENLGREPGTTGKQSAETEFVTIPRSVLTMMEKQIEHLEEELAKERQHSRDQADQLAALAIRAQDLHAGTIKKQLSPAEEESSIHVQTETEAPRRKWWPFR